jgi:hypothetical protein
MTVMQRQFDDHASGLGPVGRAIMNGHVPAIVATFKGWRRDNLVPIADVVEDVIKGFDFDDRQSAIIRAGATLAAQPHDNPFHGNRHFLEVFTVTAMLAQDAYKDERLEKNNAARLLTAALIHDYKHDGTGNNGEQFRLERLAFESAKRDLVRAGATAEDLAVIRDFLFTTDVSRDFSNPQSRSPADSVKTYSLTKDPAVLHEELKGLHERKLHDAALMLEDADIGNSLLDPELCRQSGEYLAREQGRSYDSKIEAFFLDKICHRHFFSTSGQKLIQGCMDVILQKNGLATAGPLQIRQP